MMIQSNSLPLAVLATSTCHVLETAAFAFAEPADEAMPHAFEFGYVAKILLHGDLSAILSLATTNELCRALSADIVGMDPEEVPATQAADTLGELANIIAGRLVTDWLGEDVIVRLEPPQNETLDSAGWHLLCQHPASLILQVDEQPIVVNLDLQHAL